MEAPRSPGLATSPVDLMVSSLDIGMEGKGKSAEKPATKEAGTGQPPRKGVKLLDQKVAQRMRSMVEGATSYTPSWTPTLAVGHPL